MPVILTYSPYNSLSEGTTPNLANDALGERYGGVVAAGRHARAAARPRARPGDRLPRHAVGAELHRLHGPRHHQRGDRDAGDGRRSDLARLRSERLGAPLRIAGKPRLELALTSDRDHGHLAPTLVDIAPDGTAKAISRGFLNLRYRNGLATSQNVPPGERVRATVDFAPQDHTVAAGHRIGLVLAGSNVAWALPDTPAGTTTTIHHGGAGPSSLVLPVAP